MSHHRWHNIEKIQVQVAAAAALAVMYFGVWPTLKPIDVDGAVVFLPIGAADRLIVFAAVVWALAAGCAALTTAARPSGALLATLIGVGGASVHSDPMRLLLLRFEDRPASLAGPLAAELAVLVLVGIGAMVVIAVVRSLISRIRPGLVRPIAGLAGRSEGGIGPKPQPIGATLAAFCLGYGGTADRKEKVHQSSMAHTLLTVAASSGLTLLLGWFVLTATLFSSDRGQILFALAVSFFIGAAVANYVFPARCVIPCWLAPLILGLSYYLKTALTANTAVLMGEPWAHILPVDWLCAACGGAVGGYWLACRLRDLKHITDAAAMTHPKT